MKCLITTKVVMVAVALLLLGGAPLSYAQKPNLLMMSEDADKDTVPRDSRVFRRVLTAVQNQMVEKGFDVYDETLITLDNFDQGRSRRSRAEILDIARSVSNPPIDVVTNFLIYASVNKKSYTAKIRVRVEGEILQVKSGKYLGNFESVSPREWSVSNDCASSRECVLEAVGDKARIIANDLGSVLAEKLAWMVDGGSGESPATGGDNQLETAYKLILDGFSPDEVMEMEEYLVKFTGYQTHRYGYNSNRRAEIWYEGTTSSSRMNRNMNKLLEVMGLRGTVQFSGNTVTVKKITLRNREEPSGDSEW